jgi:hypothetical protein
MSELAYPAAALRWTAVMHSCQLQTFSPSAFPISHTSLQAKGICKVPLCTTCHTQSRASGYTYAMQITNMTDI